MMLAGAGNEAAQVVLPGDPLSVATAKDDVATGGTVIIVRIRIIVVFARWVTGNRIVGIINDPEVVRANRLTGGVIMQ